MQRRHKAVAAEQSCGPRAGMLCLAQVSTHTVLPSHISFLCWVPLSALSLGSQPAKASQLQGQNLAKV